MMNKKTNWIILIVISILIKLFSFFPGAVESVYSTGIYPVIARFLRILFGWIPFSIGDIFYGVIIICLIYQIISFFKKLFKKQLGKSYFLAALKKSAFIVLLIYIFFNLLWGLNYNRRGIAYQLQLEVKPYSTNELSQLTQLIVERLNTLDSSSRTERNQLHSKSVLFTRSAQAYQTLKDKNPVFGYPSPSVKPSLYSYLGNYLGFTGYYNPFSGEAQVNTTVPVYVRPFTSCHEIGHQLGYAKENEANFSGYLAAKNSGDPAFMYSVYFDLYMYAASELYMRDSTLLVPLRESLKPTVRKDFRDLRKFYDQYQNPFEPYIRKLYGNYLKANQQPQGIMSYNEVIAWLIAYERKYGSEVI
ncbi:MAG: DUF3810 domain-containing protein [Bacteroidetes bacterium]|nr:DUF3810 domain-containing protein [Bacteroidota bacterium]